MILQWISIMDTGDAIKAAGMSQEYYQRYKSAKNDVRSDMISRTVNQVLCMIDQEG